MTNAPDWERELNSLFRPMLLPVEPDAVRVALAGRRDASAKLEEIRRVRLDYVPAYIEPLDALRWIERGGRTADDRPSTVHGS